MELVFHYMQEDCVECLFCSLPYQYPNEKKMVRFAQYKFISFRQDTG